MTDEKKVEDMSEEEALMKLAQAMKDNAPTQEDKQNVHVFLMNVATADDTTKTGNLRDDKDLNELGLPIWTVRGGLDMSMISDKLMDNNFFKEFFERQAKNTLTTSLSREGFLIKMNATTTKQVADTTKRKKTNRGMFGKKSEEVSGEGVTT